MMHESDLLASYTRQGAQDAFAELTSRYVDLVYGSARRQVGDAALADDVTQAVFLILAKKAPTLRADVVLPAWLMTATWHACQNALRMQRRRRIHETAAASMRREADDTPAEARADATHLLDRALRSLREHDRSAVMMHYLQGRSFDESASTFRTTPEAVRKRTQRAVAALRARFAGAGIEFAAPAAVGTWLTRAAAIKASPTLLAVITGKVAATGASAAIAAEALRTMALAKVKIACALALLMTTGIGGLYVALQVRPPVVNPTSLTPASLETPVNAISAPSPLVVERNPSMVVPAGTDAVTFANTVLAPHAGLNMADYAFGDDAQMKRLPQREPAVFIESKASPAAPVDQTPGMRRYIAPAADAWRGKRVEVSVYLRTQDVAGAADLEVMVWGANNTLKTGTMSGEGLRVSGTHDWRRVAGVFDLPLDATHIEFAVGLWGPGRVWIDSCMIQSVDESVPLTSSTLWHLSTQFNSKYQLVNDASEPRNGHATARIDSADPAGVAAGSSGDFAHLWRDEAALEKFRGKRVRVWAMMKSHKVTGGAGVFASAGTFDANRRLRQTDSKRKLPVHGTSAWARYSTTLVVPMDADVLSYGVRFEGIGTLWVDEIVLEVLP